MDNNTHRCRLCAKHFNNKDCVSVIQDSDLSRIIFQLFQIKICLDDLSCRLPTSICKVCHDMTNKIWVFNDRIQKAQLLLHQHLNNEGKEKDLSTISGINEQQQIVNCDKDEQTGNIEIKSSCESREAVKPITKKKPPASIKPFRRKEKEDQRWYICNTCGKQFRMQSALVVHTRCHLPADVKNRYNCDQCPKRFSTKPNLVAHKRIHSGIRNFTCDQCGKSFVQKGNLDNHLLTHTASRPFQCHLCGKSFKTLMRLRKHNSVHSDVKPHRCEVCGRHFREKGTLKEHIRIHTGVMPFTCEFCGKCFRFKGVLTTHRRQHTGERPYSCAECQHYFTNWPNYNKHMKRRHGINTSVNCRTKQDIPPTGMPQRNTIQEEVVQTVAPLIIQETTSFLNDQIQSPQQQQIVPTFYPILNLYNIPEELLSQQRI